MKEWGIEEMIKSMITFPLVEKQTCNNCSMVLDSSNLLKNITNMTEDAYGIPAVIVRCPVCKTLMEWETKCN
jgi:hypothetical protein